MGTENVTPQMIYAVVFMVVTMLSFLVILLIIVPHLSDWLDDMRDIRRLKIERIKNRWRDTR